MLFTLFALLSGLCWYARHAGLIVVLAAFLSTTARADDSADGIPVWEYGIGGGSISTPSYPGSDDLISRSIALPYAIYRGETVRLGDGGLIRARTMLTERLEVDLSFSGAFGANSEGDADREGMPDLEYLFEIGPQLVYHAYDDKTRVERHQIDMSLQARQVFSVERFPFDGRGQILETAIEYDYDAYGIGRFSFSSELSALWGSQRLHDNFYTVAPQFETVTRQRFSATDGFLGVEWDYGLGYRVNEDLRIFLRGETYFGAQNVNRDSPLFKKTRTQSLALAFVWRIDKSDRVLKSP